MGAASLLIIAIAFIIQAHWEKNFQQLIDQKAHPIRTIGIIFLALTVVFLFIVYFWEKKLYLKPREGYPKNGIIPLKYVPGITRKILLITTIIAVVILIPLMIFPIQLTILGNGVTTLISCFCIWLPLMYWIRYFSLKLRFPLFLALFIVIAVFSLFNSNKNVQLLRPVVSKSSRINLITYYKKWNKKVPQVKAFNNRKPMIIVLSEGGGIRAAYWSAKLMARIQKRHPNFRDYLFGISGVSGGSFGAAVFDGLLKPIPPLFINVTQVEDGYPVIVSNLILPDLKNIPDLNQKLIPMDFYGYLSPPRDVRISAAAHLSARFTYVGPAGTITGKDGHNIGLVDGGYFENTGANTAYQILLTLKAWNQELELKLTQKQQPEKSELKLLSGALERLSVYRTEIVPVIIYLKNGPETIEAKTSGRTIFYQLWAPTQTLFQTRESHTQNALLRLKEFVTLSDGEFITFSLQDNRNNKVDHDVIDIPLGWALSKKAQDRIDQRVDAVDRNKAGKDNNISGLSEFLK